MGSCLRLVGYREAGESDGDAPAIRMCIVMRSKQLVSVTPISLDMTARGGPAQTSTDLLR